MVRNPHLRRGFSRSSHWKPTLCFLISTVTLLLSVLAISRSPRSGKTAQTHSIYSSPTDIPQQVLNQLDAIFVLGGGVPDDLDHPPIYVQRRADDAASLLTQSPSKQPPAILCLSAGTAHVPQLLSPAGLPIWESTACAAYLAQAHNVIDNVYVETTSYDTIGNAYFARTSHTDHNGWRRILIITNEFHMTRTKAIFDWVFGLPAADTSRPPSYQLYYLSSPDVGLSHEAIEARQQREEQSATNVRENLAKKYNTMSKLWNFLHHEHALYTASKLVERGRGAGEQDTSEMVKKSYGA
eukprot:Nitzschia sp. Nitz4//scaffold137_size62074//47177//48067//NITZ4_006425-RA/size62074-processed-gene-0.95-mRNA-1//-1//CDS//3329535730//2826//frame0